MKKQEVPVIRFVHHENKLIIVGGNDLLKKFGEAYECNYLFKDDFFEVGSINQHNKIVDSGAISLGTNKELIIKFSSVNAAKAFISLFNLEDKVSCETNSVHFAVGSGSDRKPTLGATVISLDTFGNEEAFHKTVDEGLAKVILASRGNEFYIKGPEVEYLFNTFVQKFPACNNLFAKIGKYQVDINQNFLSVIPYYNEYKIKKEALAVKFNNQEERECFEALLNLEGKVSYDPKNPAILIFSANNNGKSEVMFGPSRSVLETSSNKKVFDIIDNQKKMSVSLVSEGMKLTLIGDNVSNLLKKFVEKHPEAAKLFNELTPNKCEITTLNLSVALCPKRDQDGKVVYGSTITFPNEKVKKDFVDLFNLDKYVTYSTKLPNTMHFWVEENGYAKLTLGESARELRTLRNEAIFEKMSLQFIHCNNELAIKGNTVGYLQDKFLKKCPDFSLFTLEKDELKIKKSTGSGDTGAFCGGYKEVVINFPNKKAMHYFERVFGLTTPPPRGAFEDYTDKVVHYNNPTAAYFFNRDLNGKDTKTLSYSDNSEIYTLNTLGDPSALDEDWNG